MAPSAASSPPHEEAERILLYPRSHDAERTLREVEAAFDLREVASFESGCRLVERPSGVSLDEIQRRYGDAVEVSPDRVVHVARSVNDPLYTADQQAVMEAVQAPEAWDAFQGQDPGKPRIVVALLDTGIDDNNVDLVQRAQVDPAAAAMATGLGFDVSDLVGDTTDRNGHGTASAGILAARGDNGAGIAGVAWGARVLPVKCFNDAGEAHEDRLIRCYEYITALKKAGLADVRVANNGWSGLPSSTCLMRAIGDAGKAGILSVFAAGNGTPGKDLDGSPPVPATAGLPSTISVASATLDGTIADDSNYGATTVDLAAPGRDITSLGLCPQGVAPCTQLVNVSGTSFAAPFVSGAAALIFSLHPSLGPADVKRMLTENVTLYPGLAGSVSSAGMLNIAAAIADSGPVAAPPPPPAVTPSSGPFPDGTYVVDVAEFPSPRQKSPPIRPEAGYLFVRSIEDLQEQRWLLLGWDGHPFPKPPVHSMGMNVRPVTLSYLGADGGPVVVTDLPSWTAFAQSRFVSDKSAPSTYVKVALRTVRFDGALAPPFDYPAYLDPPPPAVAAVAQIMPSAAIMLATRDTTTNQFSNVGYAFALDDGANQTRENWLVFGGGPASSGSLVVGSMGNAFGAPAFAGLMNQTAWQQGSTLSLGSVRYYPSVAE